jgi:glutathione S-transferase
VNVRSREFGIDMAEASTQLVIAVKVCHFLVRGLNAWIFELSPLVNPRRLRDWHRRLYDRRAVTRPGPRSECRPARRWSPPSPLAYAIGAPIMAVLTAGLEYEDKRPLQRYVAESQRMPGVMESHLAARQWIMDDEYTIADISMLGWVRNLIGSYKARELVDFDSLREVPAWLERGLSRPAVQPGLNIPHTS